MKILIFHGYLLRGTGSNVYNANIAKALVDLGHEVHLLCQERAPMELEFVDCTVDWDSGNRRTSVRRDPPRCTVYRPAIGGLLPVYVADRYEGIEARPFPELAETELARYIDANVAAVQEVVELVQPDLALANHLVMGPVILARALDGLDIPYAVKIHGSALEYTVKPHPERFLPYAEEGLAGASSVLVGSTHVAHRLWETVTDRSGRTRILPPGVDTELFQPLDPAEVRNALAGTVAELERESGRGVARSSTERAPTATDQVGPATDKPDESVFTRDCAEIADTLKEIDPDHQQTVAYVGKLIVSKGVDLLLAAWPLVLARVPEARLLVIGFGEFEKGLRSLVSALAMKDLEGARRIASLGRELEGGERSRLGFLASFLDSLEGQEASTYLAAAERIESSVVFIGRLEHRELASVLPVAQALVVPSTFPEAFGMVAAEAAACGALPVVADHSGLAEAADGLTEGLPLEISQLMRFDLDSNSVRAVADRLTVWLTVNRQLRSDTRVQLAETARTHYSWQGIARGVISAAQGRLEALPKPLDAT